MKFCIIQTVIVAVILILMGNTSAAKYCCIVNKSMHASVIVLDDEFLTEQWNMVEARVSVYHLIRQVNELQRIWSIASRSASVRSVDASLASLSVRKTPPAKSATVQNKPSFVKGSTFFPRCYLMMVKRIPRYTVRFAQLNQHESTRIWQPEEEQLLLLRSKERPKSTNKPSHALAKGHGKARLLSL